MNTLTREIFVCVQGALMADLTVETSKRVAIARAKVRHHVV